MSQQAHFIAAASNFRGRLEIPPYQMIPHTAPARVEPATAGLEPGGPGEIIWTLFPLRAEGGVDKKRDGFGCPNSGQNCPPVRPPKLSRALPTK